MTRRSWALDAAIAAVVLVLGQLEAWYGVNATHRQGPHWAEALAFGIGALLLLFRRVRPMLCLAGIAVVYVLEFALVGSPEGNGVALPPVIAAYSVARWERRYPTWWAVPIGVALGLCWVAFDPMDDTATKKLAGLVWLSPWLIAWLVGALVRSRAQNAEARRVAREQRAAQAVAEERNRIARELHDVIGHSVSVMTVQASAVRRRLNPEQAVERQALETVEAAGREALAEMRRMVGVLRDQGDQAGREPPPGLGQVDRLVEKFRTAGLPVRLTVSGTAQPLAPGLDLTAYRLLQEGLTNTLRHAAAPGGADVSIAYGDDCLELAVRDDGQPVSVPGEAGHGLLGMRERVSVYGGGLWSPGPGRGAASRPRRVAAAGSGRGGHDVTIRVLVADDQTLVRRGFRMILETEPGLEVVGEAADGDEAVVLAGAGAVDVVLMDVRMPGTDGIEATRRIVGSGTDGPRVIMLTTFDMDEYVYDALRAGASGFLLKDVPPEQLVTGIRAVHGGEAMLAPAVTRRMVESYLARGPAPGRPDPRLETLTPREREILVQLSRGRSNAEIAADLVVSETTVKTHVGRVLMKLGLRDRVQAVIYAYESGVVRAGGEAARATQTSR